MPSVAYSHQKPEFHESLTDFLARSLVRVMLIDFLFIRAQDAALALTISEHVLFYWLQHREGLGWPIYVTCFMRTR